MDPFEYLLTFVVIIIGLGIADMLQSLHRLLVGPRIRWHWMPPLWAAAVFLTMLAAWIINVDYQTDASPLRYLRGSTGACLLFLLSSSAFPDVEEPLPAGHPLREHFEARWRYVSILWVGFYTMGLWRVAAMRGWGGYETWTWGGLLALLILGTVTSDVRYHTGLIVLLIANAVVMIFR